jgi:hypothetical protein
MKHSRAHSWASTGGFKKMSVDKFYCTSDENHGRDCMTGGIIIL